MYLPNISRSLLSTRTSLPDKIKSGKTEISTTASKTVSSAMTDEYIAKIKEHAKRDAQAGIYMQEDFIAMKKAQQAKYISPNRTQAISQVSSAMNTITRASRIGDNIFNLLGLPYSANVQHGFTRTTAHIYNEFGEMIASYHSDNGSWKNVSTKAESQFMHETNRIYREAYRAARAEIKVSTQTHANATDVVSTSVDIKV